MKPNFSKEQLEYEFVVKHFELRDGELWRKEYVDSLGKVYKARPAKGKIGSHGYLQIQAGGKWFYVHRVIFILAHNRPIKEGQQIHHIYNNKTDNRIEHLEEVTHQVNNQNRQVHLDGKLVGGNKCGNRYQARIHVNGKQNYLGTYNTPEEAHKVYLLAVEEVNEHGHLVRSRAERNAAAGIILCPRGKRLRNSKPRDECTQLEHDQLCADSKRG